MRTQCGADQEHKSVQCVKMQHSLAKGWSIGHHGLLHSGQRVWLELERSIIDN